MDHAIVTTQASTDMQDDDGGWFSVLDEASGGRANMEHGGPMV
jgi:hypothetical protein